MDHIDHFLANLHFIGDGNFLFAVPLGMDSETSCSNVRSLEVLWGRVAKHHEVLEKHRAAGDFEKDDRTELLLKH